MILENPSIYFNLSKLLKFCAVRKRHNDGSRVIGGRWYIAHGPVDYYIRNQHVWEVVFYRCPTDIHKLPA